MNPKSFLHTIPITKPACIVPLLSLCTPLVAPATVLFSDDFNINSSGSWTVNAAPTASAAFQQATFAFDYSGFGIPSAPGTSDTLGLRLRSNIPIVNGNEATTRPAGTTSGLSISPTGQNFGNAYHLSLYAWVNFNGAANASGLADNGNSEGGTHNVMFAVGTSGTVPLVVGNTGLVVNGAMDGFGFATTGDGGITSDYRVYAKSGTFVAAATPGVYAAGSVANTATYYTTLFPAVGAPAIQQTLSTAEYGGDAQNTQAGTTQPGSFGFAWHKVDLYKNGNIITWYIDNKIIATYDASALTMGGNNIALGDSDVNTTTTRHPSLLFTLIDNLVVTDIPRPTIEATNSSGSLTLSWPASTTTGFVLQSSDSLTAPATWNNVVADFTTNSDIVSVSLGLTNAQTFFRLRQP